MSDQFPQEDRYCINCRYVVFPAYPFSENEVEKSHKCRHPYNRIVDINPVTGDKNYKFDTCMQARYTGLNPPECGLSGHWYEANPVQALKVDESDGAIKQKSPSKEKFVIGDNL